MARRRRSSVYAPAITNPRLLDTYHKILSVRALPRVPFRAARLAPITDRRLYHPTPMFRPITVSGVRHHRLSVGSVRNPLLNSRGYLSPIVRFTEPRKIAPCVRRKSRREVLFAERLTGKGSRARVRKRNEWSDISCK